MSTGQGNSSGSSAQDAQSAVVSALEGQQGGQGLATPPAQPASTPPAGGQPARQPRQQDDDGLANPFLEKVAPEDRAIVEKYVKEWDAGVTKRFQALQGELAPYKELGADPETLGQAYMLLEMLDQEPERVLQGLQEALGEGGAGEPQGEPGQQDSADDPLASLPPEFVSQFTQMRDAVEMLANVHIEREQQQTIEQQDQELDQALSSLKEQYGDFDEDYVLAKISVGLEPEDAVKAYTDLVQSKVNERASAPNIPPIMGGGGAAPPSGNGDVTKASSNDVKAMVANILRQQTAP